MVTGGAGFIGSNLALTLQKRYPGAWIQVVDDFRSGDFHNLQGFRGGVVTADISRLDWGAQFKETLFDAIFHLASITDTTVHGQFLQVHDNVEGFRRLLEFAAPNNTPIIYASSAATYGMGGGRMQENQPLAPANVYAFTKVQLENLAREYGRRHPAWKIVGLRYFNVYGPREAHKQAAASMIFQLYGQMKAGRRPRVFRAGGQKRDFVYVKDVVAMTIRALSSPGNRVYNCGSGRAFSFNETIEALNHCLGTRLEPEYFENPYGNFYQNHTEADMSLAAQELQHQPQFAPAAGIADYTAILDGKTQEDFA
jgi:ADP-L-glycero-D-manno-heptose 6-epimerase